MTGRVGVSAAYLVSGLMEVHVFVGYCTFVNAYCRSGESATFRKRRASYWNGIRSGNVPEHLRGEDLVEQILNFSKVG